MTKSENFKRSWWSHTRNSIKLNTTVRETMTIQEPFNSMVLSGSAGMGAPSALLATTLPAQDSGGGTGWGAFSPTDESRSGCSSGTLTPRVVAEIGGEDRKDFSSLSYAVLSLDSRSPLMAPRSSPLSPSVLDLNAQIPPILEKHTNVSTLVAHIGSNDATNHESEII